MTDPVPEPRDLLREAVHGWCESVGSCSHSRYPDQGPDECDEMTSAFMEDPAGARLLALAAVGLAVERLEKETPEGNRRAGRAG